MCDLCGADDAPGRVPYRRYRQGDFDELAVLAAPNGLITLDPPARTQLGEDIDFFVLQVLGDDAGYRLADHLRRGVTEQLLRRGIPRGDDSVEGLADNGVFRRS